MNLVTGSRELDHGNRQKLYFNSKYLNASDFGDQPTAWTITAISGEMIGRKSQCYNRA